jgi:hypothetical protein
LEHRYRFVVSDDRYVEHSFDEPAFVAEPLVDGLYRDTGGGGDGGHRRIRVAPFKEQLTCGLDYGAASLPSLLSTPGGVVSTSGLDSVWH